MDEQRIVYGARCSWWDDISKVGRTPKSNNGISIPCCPHCGSVLFEMTESNWWKSVDHYEANRHPGYRKMVEWRRGKHFTTQAEAEIEYAKVEGRTS